MILLQLIELGKHLWAAATFSSNFQLFRESGYFDTASELKPLMQLWLLAVEEQFYIVWPLFFVFIKNRKRLLISTVVTLAISFCYNVVMVKQNQSFAYLMPYTRFWEIASGGLLAILSSKILSLKNRIDPVIADILNLSAMVAFIASVVIFNNESLFPGWIAIIPVLVAMTWIIFGDHGMISQKLFASKILVQIGLLSYPLYLWHWSVLVMSYYIDYDFYFSDISRIGLLAFSFLLSIFSAFFWEPLF